MNNPECWKLLAIRKGELVGYWSFFSLKEDFFSQMKQWLVNDSQISVDNVVVMDQPGVYNIYIVIICIKEHYRRSGIRLLHASFIDTLNSLFASGRLINEVCVNAFTDIGEATCKNFGLKKLGKHREFGTMYCEPMQMSASRVLPGKSCLPHKKTSRLRRDVSTLISGYFMIGLF